MLPTDTRTHDSQVTSLACSSPLQLLEYCESLMCVLVDGGGRWSRTLTPRAVERTSCSGTLQIKEVIKKIKALPIDGNLAASEPNSLKAIKALRPKGPRRLWYRFNNSEYRERLEGALLGRMAGCTLGAPVEFWPVEKMRLLAKELRTSFPPTDYWTRVGGDGYGIYC